MKSIFSWVLAGGLASTSLFAQTDTSAWKMGGMGSLTFSQVGLFNWAGGGQSNMTLIGNVNLFGNFQKGTTYGENALDMAYGFIKSNFIYDPTSPITKAEDKLDFNSKWGKKAWSEKVHYSGLINFRTQFAPGFATPGDSVYLSKFLAPAYLQMAAGLDYKPTPWLSLFASPLSGKITFVADDSLAAAGAFGVNQFDEHGAPRPGSGAHARAEFGATFRVAAKGDIAKNIGGESKLDLFSNYIDRPQNIDIRWTNSLLAKVNQYVVVSFNTDLIYDHDMIIPFVDGKGKPILNQDGTQKKGPKLQIKQIFGLGLSYKF